MSKMSSKGQVEADGMSIESRKPITRSQKQAAVVPRTKVVSLLQTNHETRGIVLKTYKLDCMSTLPEENKLWWNDDDVVYFPFPTYLNTWTQLKWRPLTPIRHIMLELSEDILESIGLEVDGSFIFIKGSLLWWHKHWFQNFPFLSSVTFTTDPKYPIDQKQRAGTLEFYEPAESFKFEGYEYNTSEIKNKVTSQFQKMTEERVKDGKSWVPEIKFVGIRQA